MLSRNVRGRRSISILFGSTRHTWGRPTNIVRNWTLTKTIKKLYDHNVPFQTIFLNLIMRDDVPEKNTFSFGHWAPQFGQCPKKMHFFLGRRTSDSHLSSTPAALHRYVNLYFCSRSSPHHTGNEHVCGNERLTAAYQRRFFERSLFPSEEWKDHLTVLMELF